METDAGLVNNSVFANNHSEWGETVKSAGNVDFKNCIFYKNIANTGAGVLNTGAATLVNCNFVKNIGTGFALGQPNSEGAGINNRGRAYLLNCIFKDNYTGNGLYADWFDITGYGGSQYYVNPDYFFISKSVVQTEFPYGFNGASPETVHFANDENAIGPDNKWFTKDDGLKLLPLLSVD